MDETFVLSLIAEGESIRIDFKRDLELSGAKAKAEFIKDVIAIANSSHEGGYLLIGVQDDKQILGVQTLNEEQVQHITHVYIEPAVLVKCDVVPIASTGFLKVGIIHIQATRRPHKVARAIDFLNKDDAFVRRGSVVFKASPEEIIQMNISVTEIERKVNQYVKAAETHSRIGNYQSTIRSLSEAIELLPSDELFLKRAQAQVQLQQKSWSSDVMEALTKDLSDAIALASSFDIEKTARLLRLKNGGGQNYYSSGTREDDFEWLKNSYEGLEKAKFIFDYVTEGDFVYDNPQEALEIFWELLALGFKEPEIYKEIADAHEAMFNLGLALEAIDEGLARVQSDSLRLTLFNKKWEIFLRLGNIEEARKIYLQVKSITLDTLLSIWSLNIREQELIHQLVLKHELGATLDWEELVILKVLTLHLSRSLLWTIDRTDFITALEVLNNNYPEIVSSLRTIVGKDLWQRALDDTSITFSIEFPSVSEQVNKSNPRK